MRRLNPLPIIQDDDEGNEWLSSFSDMIMLVLCFFIILTAIFAIKDGDILEAAIDSLKGMGKTGTGNVTLVKKQETIQDVVKNLEEYVASRLHENVQVTKKRNGIEIQITEIVGQVLFRPGSAQLTRLGQDFITEIFKKILYIPPEREPLTPQQLAEMAERREIMLQSINQIEIQGHTDSLPTGRNSKYPSNWELSLMRANDVRRLREHIGVPDTLLRKIRLVGYADNKPLVPEDGLSESTEEGQSKSELKRAQDRNRRVVIFLSMVRG